MFQNALSHCFPFAAFSALIARAPANTKEVKIKTLYVMVLSAQNEVNDDGGK